jgi:hypothetical protein
MPPQSTYSGQPKAFNCSACQSPARVPVPPRAPLAPLLAIHIHPYPSISTPDASPRLSNDKPSAIFRVRSTFAFAASDDPASASQRFTQSFQQQSQPPVPVPVPVPASAAPPDVTALLGIAIEPVDAVFSQVSTLTLTTLPSSPKSALADPAVLAERIARHLLNFASSFPTTTIPQTAIEQWYHSFCGKVRAMGTSFLERAD